MEAVHLFLIIAAVASNAARNHVQHTEDSLKVVRQNVAEGKAVLVDVRSEEEWKKGHIEGSIFLPVTSLRKGGDPKALAKTLPKKKILYTFCVVGVRSRQAAFELEKHGYTVRALRPGYDDLLKVGFKKAIPKPPARDEPKRSSNAGS